MSVFLPHIKTRHGYDFPLYFPHEFLTRFLNVKYKTRGNLSATDILILCLSQLEVIPDQ